MNRTQEIYQTNRAILHHLSISYQQWQHEPILDFATDELVALRLGWTGTHSKSLFLKKKGGGFALFLTDKDSRLDKLQIKQLLGKRTSICSNDEMMAEIGCLPGAVCPFGLPIDVTIVVDSDLFALEEILYTPGLPEWTFSISGVDLRLILSTIPNQVIETKKGEA
ncbi:YbaK/EbsC family protein [Vibrio methylphosphonaticus]|uniref:YbaK/EbsC family protein n=1 Tax=Vibrio methylphosphonaticus TaxID=2946866 RepID=UPI00202A89C8|nr:YbaK/EbsC family protein [Vibrio methylphosphonaticus]MCL9773482.1 YbaK/EbsC family protein [Vibrio methylphosphonaticus]